MTPQFFICLCDDGKTVVRALEQTTAFKANDMFGPFRYYTEARAARLKVNLFIALLLQKIRQNL